MIRGFSVVAGGFGQAVGPEARARDGAGGGDRRPRRCETIVVAPLRVERADRDARAGSSRPATRISAAMARATAAKSMMPVSGRVQGGDADGVRLDLARSRRRSGGAGPGRRSRCLGARARRAGRARSSSRAMISLPQRSYGDPVLVAVGVEGFSALGAELGLQRAGRVVDAGVDDAGVVAGLVGGDRRARARARGRARRACGAAARGRWRGRGCPRRRRRRPRGVASMDRGLGDAAGAVEEVEVAALVGLGDVVGEQLRVAAGGGELSGHPRQNGGRRVLLPRRAGRGGGPGRRATIWSPVWTSASGPPTNDSGATCSTQVP